jgi:MFS family permease
MLIGSLVLGLVLALLAGGRLDNLANVRLRLVGLLFLGLALRYATQAAIEAGNATADAYRLPLFAAGFVILLAGLWVNRDQPGLSLAFVGILLNAVAVLTNGGFMPVWQPSILAAGLPGDFTASTFHKIVELPTTAGSEILGGLGATFLTQAGPLGDVIPIPVPFLRNVASIGDVFLAAGLAFFLFATTVRTPAETRRASEAAIRRRLNEVGVRRARPIDLETAHLGAVAEASALVEAAGFERPITIGASAGGGEATLAQPSTFVAVPAVPPLVERVRRQPYVRLALDGAFSALWTGQLISLLGDRVHQVALAFLVLRATDSAAAVGAVFLTATLPNLLFGPIAGTLVDRWDHRRVMIASDLLRAVIVLLIPVAAAIDIVLVYPLVFLVTTVSIFFRPAKVAIVPRIVASDDLLAANSALGIGETFADIGGYALAGLFVALLGSQLALAFWVDSVTYVGSALLIASIAVAPLARRMPAIGASKGALDVGGREGTAGVGEAEGGSGFFVELRDGWRFLRSEPVLLANTLQATVGQFMLGIFLALTPIYAAGLDGRGLEDSTVYSFIEGAIGGGNLLGGFLVGLLGARLALGRMVILGYVATGAAVAAMALAGNAYVAIGLAFGTGVGNLAFVIPSQTLFQRRTPPGLMGRVLGFRFSLVFGSMTIAMGVGGVLGETYGAASVIGVFGVVTVVAGLAGLLVRSVRDA